MQERMATQSPEQSTTPIEADSPSSSSSPKTSEDESSSLEPSDSVYRFQEENGRTYHSYKAGTYMFPNDASETDRLDFQHHIIKTMFSDRNYFAPLSKPERILDIGTGTGIWAIEMGDEFPSVEIQGTDLSPIQPDEVPDNVHFFIDDASEADWAVPASHYDYIHTRMMLGSFTDFREILKKAYHYTKPGGYVESQEMMSTPSCDDGTMLPDFPYLEWSKTIDRAAMDADRPLRIANKLKRWYEEAGFVDVQEKVFKLPLNAWPKDKHLKRLGRMTAENAQMGLSGFSLAYFGRVLSWSKAEIEVYLVNVRKAIVDRNVHAYHKFYVVWGRKPLPGEKRATPPRGSS